MHVLNAGYFQSREGVGTVEEQLAVALPDHGESPCVSKMNNRVSRLANLRCLEQRQRIFVGEGQVAEVQEGEALACASASS